MQPGLGSLSTSWFNGCVELIKKFTAQQYAQATEFWRWLGLGGKDPLFTSLFGDVFFEAVDGVWWLDTIEGTLTRPCRTVAELHGILATAEGQQEYLLAGLAGQAAQRGLIPGPTQIYDFTHTPALGGQLDADNMSVIDFVVGVNIAGQLHDQLRGLPPGTVISGVTIDGGYVRIST